MPDAPINQAIINEAISRGNTDELNELLSAIKYMIRIWRTDLESEEVADLKKNRDTLTKAIVERSEIKIAKEDILSIKDGIVLIESISLAKELKKLLASDVEGPFIKVTFGWD